MKRLAHDLNTLSRVYMAVGLLRERVQFDMSPETEIDCALQTAKVIILGEVLNLLNDMIDENYEDLDEYGFNKFEQEQIYREPDETSAVAFDGNDLPF